MTQTELEKYLWGAAIHLRGHIDAGDYKQYIFPLLFFKRISDVYDEEFAQAMKDSEGDKDYATFAEHHRFQIPDGAHWRDVRAQTTDVGAALLAAMHTIEKANPDVLGGIFGDANWTNKDRLSDATLLNLIEHFSQQTLSLAAVPQDQLGNAYEYLIKKFADDSGHTAAEFYTNRTVVRLMTLLMDPQPGESIYDPTCGSGGLLLNAALQLKEAGQEYRTLRIYGQEINLITSSIARMNMFLHGIQDFQIARGNTLSHPRLLHHDRLRQFDVVLANPPYSIKRWDQPGFQHDPWGRNIWGTPPQGCADYAFQQHIQLSTKPDTGRSVVLHPHGVLFRNQEAHIRRKMIEADVVDAVIGLGPNLFYNSPMESCLLLCRNRKPAERQGRILFINAVDEVKTEKTISHLDETHIQKILKTYRDFQDVEGFAKVVPMEDVLARDASLNIAFYVSNVRGTAAAASTLTETVAEWSASATSLRTSLTALLAELSES
ncbi:SAM-dependent DNA methyltransferase [Hymenobacter busanensis]|uniref:site-specific DNA-methyltransferase (adenine-specific) n=1 Tax=Hymenobacter busanensis TaxID=2607656 RepID=A0A7L5A1Q5_9BACT|nr:class I SAM-dependent DNA methyltransferase [Hymenobacter busanensis]KAA9338440.1 SAM-dependent DNA methyltransferase [Hymenobacter busanensis]QHJ09133.1 N-6 DNA methylase [Hymenobacter busanensis]